MAFNLLSRLIANTVDGKDEDVGSPVDDVGDEIDGESDVDFDVEEREQNDLDLSLNSSDDDDSEIRSNHSDESSAKTEFAWSDQLQNVEVELFTAWTGPNLGDLELDYTSEPYEFFKIKLYFPDNLIATIKEQTNLYAQQKISFLFYFFNIPLFYRYVVLYITGKCIHFFIFWCLHYVSIFSCSKVMLNFVKKKVRL